MEGASSDLPQEAMTLDWLGLEHNSMSEERRMLYMAKMKVLTKMICKIRYLRQLAIEHDELGHPRMHTGDAHGIYVLKLPISTTVVIAVFALLIVDDSSAKNKRSAITHADGSRAAVATSNSDDDDDDDDNENENDDDDNDDDNSTDIHEPIDNLNLDLGTYINRHLDSSKHKKTVSRRSFQNYRSALIWWHLYDSEAYGKGRAPIPDELKACLTQLIPSCKSTIGEKRRKSAIAAKDGKRPYSLFGYKEICKAFYSLRPVGRQYRWDEGIFGGLFTKLLVNTIGAFRER